MKSMTKKNRLVIIFCIFISCSSTTEKDYYSNGNVKSEVILSNGKYAIYKEYFENGNLKKVESYNELKLHGESFYYRKNSTLEERSIYYNGKLIKRFEYLANEKIKLIQLYDTISNYYWTIKYSNDSIAEKRYYNDQNQIVYFQNYRNQSVTSSVLPIINIEQDTVYTNQKLDIEVKFGVFIPNDLNVAAVINENDTIRFRKCNSRLYCFDTIMSKSGIYNLEFYFLTEHDIDTLGYNNLSYSTQIEVYKSK